MNTYTPEGRRELYYNLLVIAEGLSLTSASEINISTYGWNINNRLPRGFCGLLNDLDSEIDIDQDLPELEDAYFNLKGKRPGGYWFPRGSWRPRADLLIDAIKLTYEV